MAPPSFLVALEYFFLSPQYYMSFPIEWIGAHVDDVDNHVRLSLYTDQRTRCMRLDIVRFPRGSAKEVAKFVNGGAEWVPIKEGEDHPKGCGVEFDVFLQPLMLELFSKVLDKSGKPTKNEATMMGEIKAKESHLQDLRHLLKLPKHPDSLPAL